MFKKWILLALLLPTLALAEKKWITIGSDAVPDIFGLMPNAVESIAGQGQPQAAPPAGQPVQPQAGIGAMPPAQPAPPQPTGAMPSPMDTPMPGAPGGINMLPKRY